MTMLQEINAEVRQLGAQLAKVVLPANCVNDNFIYSFIYTTLNVHIFTPQVLYHRDCIPMYN